jgi:hypothetical protein
MRHSTTLPVLLALCVATACADTASSRTTGLLPQRSVSAAATAAPDQASFDNVLFFVRGMPIVPVANAPMLTISSPPATLLWEIRGSQPVTAPDGHQVSLGEWLTASGRASVKCINGGTHVVLHFSGLLPSATYTVWQLAFAAPGFQGNPVTNRIALGALGPSDGSGNVFHSSASGEGELSAVTPAGPLSIQGSMGECALDQFEFHYVAAYHFDGLTHGGVPGPNGTFAEQIGFRFHGR